MSDHIALVAEVERAAERLRAGANALAVGLATEARAAGVAARGIHPDDLIAAALAGRLTAHIRPPTRCPGVWGAGSTPCANEASTAAEDGTLVCVDHVRHWHAA